MKHNCMDIDECKDSSPCPAWDVAAIQEKAAQAIRDINGSPEAQDWWEKNPQLVPAYLYAQAALKAGEKYWRTDYYERYVARAQGYSSCSISVGDILRDARDDGAPTDVLMRIDAICREAAIREGWTEEQLNVLDSDPF